VANMLPIDVQNALAGIMGSYAQGVVKPAPGSAPMPPDAIAPGIQMPTGTAMPAQIPGTTMPAPEVYPPGVSLPATAFAPSGPPTGLIGSEAALQGGAEAALAGLMGGFDQAKQTLSGPLTANTAGVTGALSPYAQPGVQALNTQAALSGALGAEAQRQAYANFQESPGQAYLRDQAERALLRNQAAIGGLGGGRVRQELQRQAQGLAAQDFDAAFNRLGSVTGTGLQAAGQQASIIGNLAGQDAGNENARRLALGQIASQTGTNAADLAFRTAQSVAGNRMQTGQDIAAATGGTISALANLANQQGQDIATTIGAGAGSLADIIAAAGGQQGQSQQNLATLLANIAAGQGTQVGSLPGVPGSQQTGGILGGVGNVLQGVGSLINR